MPVINLFNKAVNGLNGAVSSIGSGLGRAVGVLDPKMGRMIASGLNPGGKSISGALSNRSNLTNIGYGSAKEINDWRVRIVVGEGSNIFYAATNTGNILEPLVATKGVVFPYTPRIDTVFQASYQEYDITHTNYPMNSYNKSSISSISISADFTAQTPVEARYVLAVIHFFRAASKMFTGEDRLAGNPPPMLFLKGYGENYFPNVPCVLTQFSHTMPDDVDYITAPSLPSSGNVEVPGELPVPSGLSAFRTKIPTVSSMTIQLQPVYSRKKVAEFSNEKFARGEYLNKGYI